MATAIVTPEIQFLGSVKRGDTWRITLTWLQELAGDPVDLSECTAKMQVRDKRKVLLAEAASCTIDTATGAITALFEPEITATVTPGICYTDQELTFLDESVMSSPTLSLLVVQDQTYE